jgi:hypothetical protein
MVRKLNPKPPLRRVEPFQQWRVASRHRVTHAEYYGFDLNTGFWGSPAWARRQALLWLRQLEAKTEGYVYWLEPGRTVLIPVAE